MELIDIRNATVAYGQKKVTASVSPIRPDHGSHLRPGTDFTFDVTATNAEALSGGVALKNVVWWVGADNQSIQLYVPPSPSVARQDPSFPPLAPGSLTNMMCLWPQQVTWVDYTRLAAGETLGIELRGRTADMKDLAGVVKIWAHVTAVPDLEGLFGLFHVVGSGGSRSIMLTS